MDSIFIDESGYTGANLFNYDQPVFALASLHMAEEECQLLKDLYFSKIQSHELKHSDMRKIKAQRQAIISFLTYLRDNRIDCVKIAVADKRYVLTAKIVDMIVEPAMYAKGIDLYKHGRNISLSNMLHLYIQGYADQKLLDRLHSSFEDLVRNKSDERFNVFLRIIDEDHGNDKVNKLLQILKDAYHVLGISMLEYLDSDQLDIALPLALVLMSKWRCEIDGPITLYHDHSSNMTKQEDIWRKLMDPKLPSIEVGYDRRRICYPIAVQETKFERSHKWVGLQLADIIAGATMMGVAVNNGLVLNNKYDSDVLQYCADVWLILKSFYIYPIMPFAKFTAEDLGTTGDDAADMIEFTMNIIR